MLKICALGIITAVSAFLLKDFGWKGAPVFCLIGFIAMLSLAGEQFSSLREVISYVGESGGVSEGAADILKVIGIGYVAGISSEVCRDLGAGSIAASVAVFARLEVLVIVAPYLLEAVKLGMELIE